MSATSVLILFFVSALLLFFSLFFLIDFIKSYKLKKIKALPFKDEYRQFLLKTPHYKHLSDMDKRKIEGSILVFIHTKEFIGVKLEVTDEMRVIIAFYACLLLLHIETQSCYDELKSIIIYSHPVILNAQHGSNGILTQEELVIEGQSANDTVVLTWHEARSEAYHLGKNNVIVHEFAHEIDYMDGEVDGVPPLQRSKYSAWVHVLDKEFKALEKISLHNRNWGKYKLLGGYAATNKAEFFAVVTERFFESPHSLKSKFPDLYNELKSFYKLDSITLVEQG